MVAQGLVLCGENGGENHTAHRTKVDMERAMDLWNERGNGRQRWPCQGRGCNLHVNQEGRRHSLLMRMSRKRERDARLGAWTDADCRWKKNGEGAVVHELVRRIKRAFRPRLP